MNHEPSYHNRTQKEQKGVTTLRTKKIKEKVKTMTNTSQIKQVKREKVSNTSYRLDSKQRITQNSENINDTPNETIMAVRTQNIN